MRPSLGRSLSRSDTFLLAVCLVLSLTALALPSRWTQAFASSVRSTALAPLLWIQTNAEEQRTSRLRLRAIAEARDSAALAAQSLAALAAENQQLRALLDLRPKVGYQTVAAEVLRQSLPTDGRTLLIGAGQSAGIAVGDPVVSPEGLIGLVISVDVASSVAMSWAHPDFAVAAVTEDGSVMGIAAPISNVGANEAFLELRGVPYRDTVAVGTQVLTSGLTGVYPKGIPIGRVTGVRREELGWERIYRLNPLANPAHVTHVLVYLIRSSNRLSIGEADSNP